LLIPAEGGGLQGREISVFDQLFGELPLLWRVTIAFGVVLALMAIIVVVIQRFTGRKLPLANVGRARQPRLGILDAFAIDTRRRLVLIRRDNVEHLIMIGGPNDVLIESEIVRAPAQAAMPPQQQRNSQPQRPNENGRTPVTAPPAAIPAAAQQRVAENPAPAAIAPTPGEPEIRPAPFRSTMPRSAPPLQAPLQANVPGLQPNAPPLPKAPARPLRAAEPPAPQRVTEAPAAAIEEPAAPPASAKPKADVDPLYADIEKKLSEALARPTAASAPAPSRSAPPAAPVRREPVMEPPAPAPAAAAKEPKSHLDALEEEMASLLGRERPS
jgi:flagellar protein FliO/FliZ